MLLTRYIPLIAAFLTITFLVTWSFADDTAPKGGILLKEAWARASIGTSRPAAAFFTAVNTGNESDRLVTITSPIAGKAEVHETTVKNGVMRMSPTGPLKIGPGETVVLKPGGLHVMLVGLRKPLKKGGSIDITLEFERAGKITVAAPIFGPGATRPPR